MTRRKFLGVLAAAAAAGLPRRLPAQSVKGKIGYLHPVTINPGHITLSILRKEWQRLGYIDGETVLTRSGEGDPQRLPGLIRELIGLGVGVLIVVGAFVAFTFYRVLRTNRGRRRLRDRNRAEGSG